MSLNIAKLLATLSQSARDQKLLARGRLVSPDQLHGLPFTSEVMPPDAWLLIGELHPRLFQLLKSGGHPSRPAQHPQRVAADVCRARYGQ